MKVEFRATYFDEKGSWSDSSDGLPNEAEAIKTGAVYLDGAKDGSYVEIARVENIKRMTRGAVKVSAYK